MSDIPRPPEALFASLQNPGEALETDTFARRNTRGYYVIIGRGPAAWFNHLTMLHPDSEWGSKRLGKLNVMHIGFEEHWIRRKNERMGQWPRMLDLFKGLGEGLGLKEDAFAKPKDWLPSNFFAKSLQDAEAYLKKQYESLEQELIIRDGHVGIIESLRRLRKYNPRSRTWERNPNYWDTLPELEKQRRSKADHLQGDGRRWREPDCNYRLSVFCKSGSGKPKLDFVYAHKVDICTGFGVARLFGEDVFKEPDGNAPDPNLYREHIAPLDRKPDNSQFRRIMDGNVYIGSDNDANHVVVVYKGNPVGAQSVQSALDMPECKSAAKRVWWMSNKALLARRGANVPGARNLVEIVGATPIVDATPRDTLPPGPQKELYENFGPETDPYQYKLYKNDDRSALLAGKLMRGEYHAIKQISSSPGKKLVVTFTSVPDKKVYELQALNPKEAADSVKQMRVELGSSLPVEAKTTDDDLVVSITTDQLVFALGQQNDDKAEGSASYIVQKLGAMRILEDTRTSQFVLGVTDDHIDRDVGVCGCVRVLGAAAAKGPGLNETEAGVYANQHRKHTNTLPKEAPAGGAGMNVCFPCIWRANGLEPSPLRLYNASQEELNAANFRAVADVIIALRSATDRSLTVAQYHMAFGWLADLDSDKYAYLRGEADALEGCSF